MKTVNTTLVYAFVSLGIFPCAIAPAQAPTPSTTAPAAEAVKPKRVNSAIEMLEQGQPVYYTSPGSGAPNAYEQGKLDAKTYADYISWDMETQPYDIEKLTEYMHGLVAGGPTRTGHLTPAVIVNLPVRGTDEATVRANSWMIEQVLATGVHGFIWSMRRRLPPCAPLWKRCAILTVTREWGRGFCRMASAALMAK